MPIRPITSNDTAILKQLTLDSVLDAPYAFGGESTYAEELARPDDHWQTFAAELAGDVPEWRDKCIGFLLIDHATARGKIICTLAIRNPKLALITGMWVAPHARRQGFGRKLLEAAVRWSREHGAQRMKLWVDDTNPAGTEFYRALGFQPTGESRPVAEGSPTLERAFARNLTAPTPL